ncbi:MAG: SusD/RagB family nutrient-binding outer membrane lipoprotein, partial [Flavobacteriaceae bacterium]
MKLHKILFVSIALFAAVISCDDFDDLNIDPNSATSVDPSNLVSYAQFNMYDAIHGRGLNMEHGKLMVQHWAQNEYAEESRYLIGPGVANSVWSEFYTNVLKELEVAKELIDNQSIADNVKNNQKAIIDILKVNAYMLLTDTFGDIPYSQAINPEFDSPAYDSQENVYTEMLSTLQTAATSFDLNAPSFASGDIIYNGSVSHWKKFAHSLMLRLAMRVSDVAPSLASQYAAVAATDLITSHADEPRFVFDAAPARSNPMWRDKVLGSRDDFCISDVLVQSLRDLNDPRLDMFADPAPGNTEIVGMPYGLDDNSASVLKSSTSRPHADL